MQELFPQDDVICQVFALRAEETFSLVDDLFQII